MTPTRSMSIRCSSKLSFFGVALAGALGLFIAGCSLSPVEPTSTPAPVLEFDGLGSVPFDQYVSRFVLTFEADPGWQYQLTVRRSEAALERTLVIEGVEDTRDPGDVRMVTARGITRMRGPGTEDRCLQFPEQMDVNVTLLSPDDILPPVEFTEPLNLLGQEQVVGFDSNHYAVQQAELDGWQQVRADIWISRLGSTIVQYELAASGWDPYFGAGWGQLSGRYQLLEVGQQTIEPIEGCRVDLPLPASVVNLVVLPQVVAFSSEQNLQALTTFYQEQLDEQGWRALVQEERTSGAVVLTYLREGERLIVTIRQFADGTQVELLRE